MTTGPERTSARDASASADSLSPHASHRGATTATQSENAAADTFTPLPGYDDAVPARPVQPRRDREVIVDERMVRLLEEGAVKYNTFPSRPGYPSGAANIRTHLHVEAWIRNTTFTKHVWIDLHVSTYDGGVVHTETRPLTYQRPAGDGGDVFVLDGDLYQGLVATPGSVDPRPDARVVQYRLYCELDGHVYSDGRVHMCYLKPDALSE